MPYLRAANVQWAGVNGQDLKYMYIEPEQVRRYSVQQGDLLVCEGGEVGRCSMFNGFHSTKPLIIQNSVHRVRPRSGDVVESKFLGYVLSLASGLGWLTAMTNKATIGHLTKEKFNSILVPSPPPEWQRLLVRYLDHAELRIARAVQSKRRLAALLDERRRAAIQSLVIGGACQGSDVKASGIEWLGTVPAHWEIRPAKFFFKEVNERSAKGEEELLSVSHLTGVTPRATKTITMFMAASYVGHKVCRQGDLVVNTMWAWMGALGVASQTGIVSPAYAVYRPLPDSPLSPLYAGLLLRTRPYVDEYTCRSTGIRSSRLRLYPDRFLSIPIVCPLPDEQLKIVNRAESETRGLTAAIAAVLSEIDLLLEYRTRLIADVVTGKLDVRLQAGSLPEVDPAELAAVLSTSMGAEADLDEEAEEFVDAV